MDDVEASHFHEGVFREGQVTEAALLALGPKLEWGMPWQVNHKVTAWDSQVIADHLRYGEQWYHIRQEAKTDRGGREGREGGSADNAVSGTCSGTYVAFTPGLMCTLEQGFYGPVQRTLVAAKAACERHHARGEWD